MIKKHELMLKNFDCQEIENFELIRKRELLS